MVIALRHPFRYHLAGGDRRSSEGNLKEPVWIREAWPDKERQTINLIGSGPPSNTRGADGGSGRRTFDKTASSKPLAFAADAAAMGIQWRCGTWVRVGTRIFRRMDRPFGGLISLVARRIFWRAAGSMIGRGENSHTSGVRGVANRIRRLSRRVQRPAISAGPKHALNA